MAHEVSETIQDPETGRWINVYGKNTPKAGQRLPADESGVGHEDYGTVDEAVKAATKRSELHVHEGEAAFKRGFDRVRKPKKRSGGK